MKLIRSHLVATASRSGALILLASNEVAHATDEIQVYNAGIAEIGQFTIKNAPARMKKLKRDPVIPVLDEQPDLVKALGLLQARV